MLHTTNRGRSRWRKEEGAVSSGTFAKAVSTAEEGAEIGEKRFVGAQEKVIDPTAAKALHEHFGIEPAAAAMRDEAATRFGFARPKNAAADSTGFGRILQLQHDAVMFLSHDF